MALSFALASNRLTVTGQYATFTATAASTNPDAATWSCTGTLSNVQTAVTGIPTPTTALFVGRGIVRSSGTKSTVARIIDHSYIRSISGVTGTVTITGTRQYLTDGTEDVFTIANGDVLQICGSEIEIGQWGGATAGSNITLTRSAIDWTSFAARRTDIAMTPGAPSILSLGTVTQGISLTVNNAGYVHLGWSDSDIYQGPLCPITDAGNVYAPTAGYIAVNGTGHLLMGRLQTTITSGIPVTLPVYPTARLTCDTQAAQNWQGSSMALNGYTVLAMNFEGPAYSPKTFGGVTHVRQCRWSSFANAGSGNNSLWFLVNGTTTVDSLTTYGTGSFTKTAVNPGDTGGQPIIYNITNGGSSFNQNEKSNNPFRVFGYNSKGALADFGGWQNTLPTVVSNNPMQATGTFLQSWDSPLGTNAYVSSADITFAGGNQNSNTEIWRRVTPVVSGTGVTNGVVYLKDVTRSVGTTSAAARGRITDVTNAGGNQDNTGATVTSRNGTTVASDGTALQNDRTYVIPSGTQTNVLLGELYSCGASTDSSRLGRTGYDGGPTGVTSTRVSRRAKDDTQGSRTNRDNYDLYAWSYNGAFVRETDYSMNSGATGSSTTVSIGQLVDLNITQSNSATVATYTDLSASGRLYDYAKYYKTASGTVDGRTQKVRLELGGVDGTTPGSALTAGGGGYLAYPLAGTTQFNPIFSGFTINGGTNATPFQVAAGTQGPVNGTWTGTTYNYGDCVPAIATTQGALTMYVGAAGAIGGTAPLNFGARDVNISNNGNATAGSYAPMQAGTFTYTSNSTVLTGLNAGTSILLPTTGTAINTSGTIVQGDGTSVISTTLSGSTTIQGGFTVTNPMNFTGAHPLVVSGNNTFNGACSWSPQVITLGDVYSTSTVGGARSTFNAALNLPVLAVAVNSMVGTSLVISSSTANTTIGTGLDRIGANSVLLSGNLTATTGISGAVTISGASVGGTASVTTTNAGLGALALTDYTASAASGQAQSFSAVGPVTATRARFNGNNATFTTGSAAVLTLTGCTSSGTVTQSGGLGTIIDSSVFSGATTLTTPTTIAIQNSSQLSGGLTAPAALTVAVNNSAVNGLTANAAQQFNLQGNASVGNVSLTSCDTANFTAGGIANGATISNAGKTTAYNFTNLTLSNTLNIAQAPATATTIAPARLVMNSGAILNIDCGASNNLAIDCTNVLFADATATFARAAGATGTIALLNWPSGKAVPTGFSANVFTTMTLSFTDSPATAPTIRVAELYDGSGNPVTLPTPVYSAGAYTWSFTSVASATYGGAVFLVDGYAIARGTSAVNTAINATAVPEGNVDFGQALVAADTTFIGTTTIDTTNYNAATNAYIKLTTSTAVDYTTSPSTRTAVEKAKLVFRRMLETSAAGTVAWRKLVARGLLAPNVFTFTQTGLAVNQIVGLATNGVGIQFNKINSNNAVVTFSIWVVDAGGDFWNTNTANGRSTTSPTTLLLFEGFSPGAVANLTSNQINQVAAGTVSSLSPSLTVINNNVKLASLGIPASANLPTTNTQEFLTLPQLSAPDAEGPLTYRTVNGDVVVAYQAVGGYSESFKQVVALNTNNNTLTFSNWVFPQTGIAGTWGSDTELGRWEFDVDSAGQITDQRSTIAGWNPVVSGGTLT